VPVLGDLPLLGLLFGKQSRDRTRNRFFIFLRPNVLRSERFRDLQHISRAAGRAAGIDDGLPTLAARIIR
jgi:type II secretory pathway component GspD/PulD (secretin)